jgi:tetratricopeptide (TPR) repeat protein
MHPSEKRLNKVVKVALESGRPALRMTLVDALSVGMRLQQAGDLRAAESVFRELCKQVPKAEPARGLLAEALLAQQFPVRAQKAIAPLLDKAEDPGTLLIGSRVARRMLRLEEARALVERATRMDRARVDLLFELASCEMDLGHRERAADLLTEVLRVAPDLAAAYWQRAQLDLTEHDSEHLAEMEALLAGERFSRDDCAFLHFACARIQQRRGDVAAEFRHLDEGNRIIVRRRPWDPGIPRARHERIRNFLADGWSDGRVRADARDDLAPILVASMPRSGSTLVERILGAHADVTPCGEWGLFPCAAAEVLRDLDAHDIDELWSGRLALADLLDAIAVQISTFVGALGIGTPRFSDKGILNFEYLPFLLLAFPRARAIHVVRHPLDAALSAYQMHFSESHGYAYDLRAFARRYRQHVEFMESWRQMFPGRIATVRYEELVQRPDETVRSLLEFCELAWDERCLRFHEDRRAVQTASFLQVRRPLHTASVGKYARYGRLLAPAAEELGLDPSA